MDGHGQYKRKKPKHGKRRNKMKRMIEEDVEVYYDKESANEFDNNFKTMSYAQASFAKPKNGNQRRYLDLLKSQETSVVIAVGPAGTGKTMLATEAAVKEFTSGKIWKIIITRPAVSTDEQHGFLPGSLEDKMSPWVRPIYDILEKHFSCRDIQSFMREKYIEIVPLAYMRGRTFENAWILADEMQNSTISQMKMILTRIGDGSKLIITGDTRQHDRGYEFNGLSDLCKKIHLNKEHIGNKISMIRFNGNDVERHPVVKLVLDMYEDNMQKSDQKSDQKPSQNMIKKDIITTNVNECVYICDSDKTDDTDDTEETTIGGIAYAMTTIF